MHYVIIIIFIVVIIWLQFKFFSQTKRKLQVFKTIFPIDAYNEWHLLKDASTAVRIVGKEDYEAVKNSKSEQVQELKLAVKTSEKKIKELKNSKKQLTFFDDEQYDSIDAQISEEELCLLDLREKLSEAKTTDFEIPLYYSNNSVRYTIITSINKYLERNNSSTSDFYLIKDIVDRNCDSTEDEIQTQIPVPLYCGLMGTMLGIIVGIMFLWLSGDLDALLSMDTMTQGGVAGITALLGGVALAMISSFVGIVLTTRGSWLAKQIKSEEELLKHEFLSWMQAELLPVMNTDAASAMRMMVDNLSTFNDAFAKNTKELNSSLSKVTDTTKSQSELLESIKALKIQNLVSANIGVYDKLKSCTKEIGQLGVYLSNVNGYLDKVNALSQKLDDADDRCRMIEEMALFFKEERSQLDRIKAVINESMGEADSALQKSIGILKENVTKQNDEFMQHFVVQNQRLSNAFAEQQDILSKALSKQQEVLVTRSNEISGLMSELKQLTEVKETMKNIESAISANNNKLDNLVSSISRLAEKKDSVDNDQQQRSNMLDSVPKWVIILVVSLIAISFIWFNIWTVLSLL